MPITSQEGGSRIRVFPNGTLLIDDTRPEDEGLYVCDATNIAGTIRLAVQVLIREVTSE